MRAVLSFSPTATACTDMPEEEQMDFIVAGVIAVLLAGYLIHALLHPDRF